MRILSPLPARGEAEAKDLGLHTILRSLSAVFSIRRSTRRLARDASAAPRRCLLGGAGVPDAFGIDHHRGPELAAIETARRVDSHILQPQRLRLVLHVIAQRLAAFSAQQPRGCRPAGGWCSRRHGLVVRLGSAGFSRLLIPPTPLAGGDVGELRPEACCICCICSTPCIEAGSRS